MPRVPRIASLIAAAKVYASTWARAAATQEKPAARCAASAAQLAPALRLPRDPGQRVREVRGVARVEVLARSPHRSRRRRGCAPRSPGRRRASPPGRSARSPRAGRGGRGRSPRRRARRAAPPAPAPPPSRRRRAAGHRPGGRAPLAAAPGSCAARRRRRRGSDARRPADRAVAPAPARDHGGATTIRSRGTPHSAAASVAVVRETHTTASARRAAARWARRAKARKRGSKHSGNRSNARSCSVTTWAGPPVRDAAAGSAWWMTSAPAARARRGSSSARPAPVLGGVSRTRPGRRPPGRGGARSPPRRPRRRARAGRGPGARGRRRSRSGLAGRTSCR